MGPGQCELLTRFECFIPKCFHESEELLVALKQDLTDRWIRPVT